MASEKVFTIPTNKLGKYIKQKEVNQYGLFFYRFSNEENYQTFLEFSKTHFKFCDRKTGEKETDAEFNDQFQQIIPYCIFVDNENKILFYQRGSEDYDEARLAQKVSIGVGGHINDKINLNGDFFRETAYREIGEELIVLQNNQPITTFQIPDYINLQPIGLLKQNDEVGRFHVGLVFIASIRLEKQLETQIKVNTSGENIQMKINQKNDLWLNPEQFYQLKSEGRLSPEGWTKALIKILFGNH